MRNYRDLQVWNKARNLTLELYRLSRGFPRRNLWSQPAGCDGQPCQLEPAWRKAAVAAPASEWAGFVRIAMGSASELDYRLLLSRDLGFMNGDGFTRTAAELKEVRKMLTSFLCSVEGQIELRSKAATKY